MAKSFNVKTIFSATDKLSPSLGKMMKNITSQVALGTLAAKGISNAFAGIGNSLKAIPQWASGADQILKDANKLGIESETLQRFRYAALHANVEASSLDSALLTMTKNLGSGALVSSLNKIDGSLSDQVKNAGTVEEAFSIIAKAMNEEKDAGRRASIGTAAFGKSFANLIPMFDDLEETMQKAGRYGFIIPKEASQRANDFSTSMTNLQTSLGFFQNLANDLLIKYVTPLVDKFLEWTVQNRELVSTKLAEFIAGVAGGVQWMINKIPDFIDAVKGIIKFAKREIMPVVYWIKERLSDILGVLEDLGPAILGVWGAFKIYKTASAALFAVSFAMETFAASQAASAAAGVAQNITVGTTSGLLTTLKTALFSATDAQEGLNLAMAANMGGIIIAGLIVLITGASFAVKKLSGDVLSMGDSFLVVGQTINRAIGFFLNPIYDLIQSILALGPYLPGAIGKSFSGAWNNWENFQNNMNMKFTGSTDYGLFNLGDSYKMAMDRATGGTGTTTGTGEDGLGGTGDPLLGGLITGMDDIKTFLEEWFKTFSEENSANTSAINGLGGGSSMNINAPSLAWKSAGAADLFGTVRNGL